MIYAHVSHWKNYSALGDAFQRAMSLLVRPDLVELPAGRTEVIPGKLWLSIEETETHEVGEVSFEAHREFVDVQTTLKGIERIGFAPIGCLRPKGHYDEAEDIQYFSGDGIELDCSGGMFALFFPEDGHRPCTAPASDVGRIKKAVVKIHRSLLDGGASR
ncbi:MAG: YhcH/YjgK/YiaL family protein [Pyramidobacter sp.]|jgi:biofilm protein TabA